ncbi:MAG: hypothetical protein PHI24_08800 [Desulfitobacteriaceae bacterium]|nr:hypothetical protein [Desulfitobacteriaceae bacterium]
MFEGAKSYIGGTWDMAKGNPAGAAGIGIVSILGWEIGGRKLFCHIKERVQNSAVVEAAKAQASKLKKQDAATTPAATPVTVVATTVVEEDPDEEMREQIIKTAQTVEAAASAAKKKFED